MNTAIAPTTTPRPLPSARRAVRPPGYDRRSAPSLAWHSLPRSPAAAAPLWPGAWVGWLTCQAGLLLLVESSELGADPRIAVMTRALLLTAFVTAFRKPCFATQPQRHVFTLSVMIAEVTIAACCNRLADATGWAVWVAISAALLLLLSALDAPSDCADRSPG